MPVADSSSDDDFLQQFLAGHQAGQAFGASQPYGPSGVPGPYSGGPQALMPGGGLLGRQQSTPGAPSMGYPAMGQPIDPRPAQMATSAGLSLNSNPLTGAYNWLKNNVSIGAPNFSNALPPEFWHDYATAKQKLGNLFGGPMPANNAVGGGYMGPYVGSPPAATATAPPAPFSSGGGIGSDANFPVMGAGGFPTTYGAPGQQPPTSNAPISVATSPRGVKRTDAAYGPYDAPGAGAPAGNPSQTPRPARNPFAMIDRVNAGPVTQPGRGYQTALDLSSLFGGRGQQAANPANVPAANAQAVSGALGSGGMSNAPWNVGPLQKGMVWPGAMGPFTQDQLAARGLKQRYG